jgi:hypothetical protein
VRVRFTDAAGNYLAPFGRYARFPVGLNQAVGGSVLVDGRAHAYIDGECEIRLPAGAVHVEVSKGLEYEPIRQDVVLGAGQMTLRLMLTHRADLRSADWYAGDTRAHFLSPHAALLEGMAEDLAVVNLLAAEWRSSDLEGAVTAPDLLTFSGRVPAIAGPHCMVVVNTLNVHPVLGCLGLLHCHRVVYPLRFGAPDYTDDWSLGDWCDQCHRKAGLVVWTHPNEPVTGANQSSTGGEALANLILGKVDAYEFCRQEGPLPDALGLWYRLLNAGLRVPLVAGSGKTGNDRALGSPRVYASMVKNEALFYQRWIGALRAGRTFVTNGPLLVATVNGYDAGADLSAERARVVARLIGLGTLEIVVNGAPVHRTSGAALDVEIDLPSGGWLAVRGTDSEGRHAHTSAWYVRGRWGESTTDAGASAHLVAILDETSRWVVERGRFDAASQRDRLLETLRQARQALAKRQSNPGQPHSP